MRCAEAAGAEVYVLGNEASKGFRYSCRIKEFVLSKTKIDRSGSDAILDEINRYVAEFGIDLVIAGDAPATRSICALKQRIMAPCFPLPTLEQFDFMNDKWQFTQMCNQLGIQTPPSRLFENKEELLSAMGAGEVKLPCMAKALALEGNHGIFKLEAATARETIAKIDYKPILVQDFMPGDDIDASVFARDGKVECYSVHHVKQATYSILDLDAVRDAMARIVAKMGVSGVYDFDMRQTADGRLYYLECNPRLFFKCNLSMVAGINFVTPGLPGGKTHAKLAPGTAVRRPKALALALVTQPWSVTRRDFAMLCYLLSDPLPYFREMWRLEWEP
jgi:biotin carboxylase